MKKTAIILAAAAALFCAVLAGCDGTAERESTDPIVSVRDNTTTTGQGLLDTTPREEMNTVSEFFSEAASDLETAGFLDPENGIISDTHRAD